MGELRKIPNVGKKTEKILTEMGYTTIDSLKGKTGEQRLYIRLKNRKCRFFEKRN